jgi:hypothetical protein
VLVTGDNRHNHAENGCMGPESMMLHKITSCVGMSYTSLTVLIITLSFENVKQNRRKISEKKAVILALKLQSFWGFLHHGWF